MGMHRLVHYVCLMVWKTMHVRRLASYPMPQCFQSVSFCSSRRQLLESGRMVVDLDDIGDSLVPNMRLYLYAGPHQTCTSVWPRSPMYLYADEDRVAPVHQSVRGDILPNMYSGEAPTGLA